MSLTNGIRSNVVLFANTLSFTICFACWMLYGVLITFFIDNGIFYFDKTEMGLLIGTPVLTGSILRLPVGVWTDRYGGRNVFAIIMIVSALFMFGVSLCNSFWGFLIAGLGFGIAGASFAAGIAYTSVWFSKDRQGTALGIFGAGNAGAAITSLCAPYLLTLLTNNLQNLNGWRNLPKLYAVALLLTTIFFWLLTESKKTVREKPLTLIEQLEPLKSPRVWRFGLYYFFVFGGFVALSQWLIPYYLNVYGMSLAFAGLLASIFSLPSGLVRAIGGWLSDKYGARSVMYMVLCSCLIASILLIVPRMDIVSPGEGVPSLNKGIVTRIEPDLIEVSGTKYKLRPKFVDNVIIKADENEKLLIWPTFTFWQEPVVKVGDQVIKKQILARGITHIFFQANVWIFTVLVFVVGFMTGIGKAAVYKHIPDYFPNDVGVVGGIVGVVGGLGGFFGPVIFGTLLSLTGIWTTCWMFFALLCLVCLTWMHITVAKLMNESVPSLAGKIEA